MVSCKTLPQVAKSKHINNIPKEHNWRGILRSCRIRPLLFLIMITSGLFLHLCQHYDKTSSLATYTPLGRSVSHLFGGSGGASFHTEEENTKQEVRSEQDKKMLNDFSGIFKITSVDCASIFEGVQNVIDSAVRLANKYKKASFILNEDYYLTLTSSCRNFTRLRGYITSSLTKQEREFPIAFSILAYTEIEMLERLLRSIYRPQNWYCLHIDKKSSEEFYSAVEAIANCFPNVFMASRRIDVQWGTFTVLEPDLVCMEDLLKKGHWKYFINLTGQEMPLKTNYELVKILTAYKGANDVNASVEWVIRRRWRGLTPPLGLRPLKGSVHIVVNRDFVDYALHNDSALTLMKWVKKTQVPDETYFTMLNHNPQLGIPGSYKGWPETAPDLDKVYLARYKHWGQYTYSFPCASHYWLRHICQLSTGDLPYLRDRPELFANKFQITYDRIAIGCLEEKLFNDTRDEFFGLKDFNTSFYANQGFVRNQILRNESYKGVMDLHGYEQLTTPAS